jgi:hypothetical protein
VRQSRGDWHTGNFGLAKRNVIPPLTIGTANSLEEYRLSAVEAEEAWYREQSALNSPTNGSNYASNALGSPVIGTPGGRARRIRYLAASAAERRRQPQQPTSSAPAPDFMEVEGVARPNPRPQMEISVSQESPRRPTTARRTNQNQAANRRPRPVRFDVRRTLREHGESDIDNVELEEESFSEAHVSTSESSSSEDSDSDWGGTLGTSATREREESRRKAATDGRKRSRRLNSNSSANSDPDDSDHVKKEPESEEEDDDEPRPGPSSEMKIKTEPVKQSRPRKAV